MNQSTSSSQVLNASRRRFLKQSGMVGGGLVMGVSLSACAATSADNRSETGFRPDAFLHITDKNQFHFYMPRSEMGQGTYTGLTTVLAEDLDVDPANIIIHHASVDEAFINADYGMQVTGGSTSMKLHYRTLRQLGANTKALIIQAAAQSLKVSVDQIRTENGQILVADKAIPYGEFAVLAGTLELAKDAALKPDNAFRYIGKDRPRLDALAKSTGTAKFGIDVDFPGLYRAVLLRCPVAGGTVKQFDATAALAMTGVHKVVKIHNGVAVVAEHYWQAKQALTNLKVEWEKPETLSAFSSDTGKAQFEAAINGDDFDTAFEQGDTDKALKAAAQTVTADYWAPYLAHATMEPMNCTVKIEEGQCEVWVGCQSPQIAQGLAAFYGDVDKDKVKVHSLFLGGGFGRRAASDYVGEAAAIAKESGVPIQLVWSREDDTQHDVYRPASMARFTVGLDKEGNISAWRVRRAGPNIMPYTIDEAVDAVAPAFLPNGMVDWMSKGGYGLFDGWTVDHASVEGLYEDYDASNKDVQHTTVDPGLPLGYWRSVGHSFSAFFKESMMDELAHKTQQDPVAFRLKHVGDNPKLKNVIEVAAKQSGWGQAAKNNRYLGFSAHTSFLAAVAQVAEVSVKNDQITVHKVVCVIDCGKVVNPEIVKAQMESGIIFGLTAALHGEITLEDGVVQQSNFHDYPMLRMPETPEIEVHIINSPNDPTGVGEPGLPPIAGAVANAIYAATGKRLRSLPLTLSS